MPPLPGGQPVAAGEEWAGRGGVKEVGEDREQGWVWRGGGNLCGVEMDTDATFITQSCLPLSKHQTRRKVKWGQMEEVENESSSIRNFEQCGQVIPKTLRLVLIFNLILNLYVLYKWSVNISVQNPFLWLLVYLGTPLSSWNMAHLKQKKTTIYFKLPNKTKPLESRIEKEKKKWNWFNKNYKNLFHQGYEELIKVILQQTHDGLAVDIN